MGKTILTGTQIAALRMVMQEPRLASFYLSGGTALAEYYLQHRLSDDLDFFAPEVADGLFLDSYIPIIAEQIGATTVRQERVYDRKLFFFTLQNGELKMEFTKYPFACLEPHKVVEGVRVDSIRDIAANKLAALLDRFEPKDFVDLFFLLQTFYLEDIWHDTEKKFGLTISPLFLGSELAKVQRIEELPTMCVPLTVQALKDFFTKQALQLKSNILTD